MKKEYDFSKGKRGAYNKKMAKDKGLPYQTLINLFLRSCKDEKLEIDIDWKKHG